MMTDLLCQLKGAYAAAREHDDRRGMELAARAISYATSGDRDLATKLAIDELHITLEA
jgi:hypothetical protein